MSENRSRDGRTAEAGDVYVFWGDGKGKTTAALGMALRALGHGWRVLMIQFLKGGAPTGGGESGEFTALDRIEGFSHIRFGDPTLLLGQPNPAQQDAARHALDAARDAFRSKAYDLIILDEVLYAIELQALPVEDVIRVLCSRPAETAVVLTGGWSEIPEITALADLVTEMRRQKHPFDMGKDARAGIEY